MKASEPITRSLYRGKLPFLDRRLCALTKAEALASDRGWHAVVESTWGDGWRDASIVEPHNVVLSQSSFARLHI
jgi:hypothetical protein